MMCMNDGDAKMRAKQSQQREKKSLSALRAAYDVAIKKNDNINDVESHLVFMVQHYVFFQCQRDSS